MSLKVQISVEGQSFINTEYAQINTGEKQITFEAVCKVVAIQGDKSNLTATVSFKGDKANYHRNYQFEASVADGSVNFIKQAYLHIKRLPDFATAEDC